MWIGVALTAWAGPEVWVGAGATSGVTYDTANGVAPVLSQAEVDLQTTWEEVMVRIDLDLHVNPADPLGPLPLPYPPEGAYVELGRSAGPYLRAGVVNPGYGLESWDERDNYLPTYATSWALANGQVAGAEPGFRLEDGTELFVFGGYDIAWFSPIVGAGGTSEHDGWGTWTGAYYHTGVQAISLFSANEVYPADWLWLTLQLNGGLVTGTPWGGPLFIANLFPDATVGGALRVDPIFNAAAAETAFGVPISPLTLSGAVRFWPTDWLYFAVEGKALWPSGGAGPVPGGTLLVDLHVPEPE